MRKSTLLFIAILVLFSCKNETKTTSVNKLQTKEIKKYPSDVLPFMNKWQILLGDGTRSKDLVNFEKKDFFYKILCINFSKKIK